MTPWTAAHQASLSLTISWGLPKRISDAIQPSHPPSRCCSTFNLSRQQKVFSSESAVPIRWPKYWSFSFSISPSSECSGLISFRIDWFDLLAVQGTLKSLFQHHSSKASILRGSAFFMVQLSQPYEITEKTRASTIRIFHLNTLLRFVIVFVPRTSLCLI